MTGSAVLAVGAEVAQTHELVACGSLGIRQRSFHLAAGENLQRIGVHVGKTEKICDRVHPEELMTRLENASEPICIIDEIEYGNFMILLAEANCSHNNIFNYVTNKLLRDDPSQYYSYYMYLTPEINFHLITLDDNGEFTCQTGGEELAAIFYKGYETPALHPLSYHITNFGDDYAKIHIK